MYLERDVLVNTRIAPPDTLGLRIRAVIRRDAFQLPHFPLAFGDLFQVHPCARHAFDLFVLVHAPAAKVMRAGDNTRSEAFGYPGMKDEVTDFRVDLHEIAGTHIAECLG